MLWKFAEVASDRLEVSIAGRARRSVTGIFTRYPRTLTRREMTKLGVIPVTTPTRTLLDLAAIVDPATLEDALDDGIRHGLVTAKALLTRLSGTDPRGRCGLPVLEAPAYQRVGRPLAGSRLETFVRRTFARAGLPTPIPQYEIVARDGSFVGRVDFAFPEARLAIEVDGYAFHSSRKDWERDRVRQNEVVALGWFVLRTTKRQMTERPQDFVALVWRRLATPGGVKTRQNRRLRQPGEG